MADWITVQILIGNRAVNVVCCFAICSVRRQQMFDYWRCSCENTGSCSVTGSRTDTSCTVSWGLRRWSLCVYRKIHYLALLTGDGTLGSRTLYWSMIFSTNFCFSRRSSLSFSLKESTGSIRTEQECSCQVFITSVSKSN